ncbi:MAG: hypothetical protein NTV58_17860 [Deltaproteobacteria bacterium]|nr:hypothetical protein [Deltaproteobacteria bacterium]
MKDFVSDGVIIGRHIKGADLKSGLSFFTEESDYLQLGSWRYDKGRKLSAHIHNYVKREINRTQECIVVMAGSIKVIMYDEGGEFLEEVRVNSGEAMVLFSGGHGYEILDNDTIVFEIKNGPYPGAEKDRRRI